MSHRPLHRWIGACLVAGAIVAPAAAAVDPFYLQRLEDGVAAYERGDAHAARRQLRIAAFGLLDEPALLSATLMRLAVAEAALGDAAAFRRSYERLAQVDRRFATMATLDVPEEIGAAFEDAALRWIPATALREAFPDLAERAERRSWQSLPPQQRRKELQRRMAAEPGDGHWLVEMARLELLERRPKRALDWLDRLPAAAGGEAICLRQQAASESQQCARTDLTSPFCPGVPPSVAVFHLDCLVAARRWSEAAALLDRLPEGAGPAGKIARLRQRIEAASPAGSEVATAPQGPGATGATAPTEAADGPAPPTPTAGAAAPPTPAAGGSAPAAPAEPSRSNRLSRMRDALYAAAGREQAQAVLHEAIRLADADAGWRDAQLLAGEAAYLIGDWDHAVAYFGRAGEVGDAEPSLAFYYAVSLWESGRRAAAADLLGRILPSLERSQVVDDYVRRVLGDDDAATASGDSG